MTAVDSPAAASPFAYACARERDASRSVVLVGFKNQGNLGLGYLAATLESVLREQFAAKGEQVVVRNLAAFRAGQEASS